MKQLTNTAKQDNHHIEWGQSIPFYIMHLMPLAALWTGTTAADWITCGVLYAVGMFFITAGYHRFFAHRTFKTGRIMQFIFAVGAQSSAQKGALWWAGHHRDHHKYSDTANDVHSPRHGFWWSHVGWILSSKYMDTKMERIRDFAKYPELRWLDRYHMVPAVALGFFVYLFGGASALFIGFFLSRVLLYHGTFIVNSLAHVIGRPRYETGEDSKNSAIIALLTLGEGWHNNHHYYQSSTSQGFYWWEIDMTYMVLKVMSWMRLVSGLRRPPAHILAENRVQRKPDVNESAAVDMPAFEADAAAHELPALPMLTELPMLSELPDMATLPKLQSTSPMPHRTMR